MEIPPKQQRCEDNQSKLNNQLQNHDMEIPIQPEPLKDMVRNEDIG